MRFLPSVIGLSITAKVAVVESTSSKNLISIAPHPRFLIEAVSQEAPVSFIEYVNSKRPSSTGGPDSVSGAGDATFCRAPLSHDSKFLQTQSDMLSGGGKMMEMFLDTFATEIRKNIWSKIINIQEAWKASVGAELDRIGQAMKGQKNWYSEHAGHADGLAVKAREASDRKSVV